LIRRAPTGRSRYGTRSWPTRRTRPPAGAPPTTDPRSSEHDRPTDAVRRGGAASLPARGPRGPGRPRAVRVDAGADHAVLGHIGIHRGRAGARHPASAIYSDVRSEEHTSELQSPDHLVCRLLLEKKKENAQHDETQSVT